MTKAPSALDPRRHPERALQRRQGILQIMRAEGIISSEEFRAAADAPLLDPAMHRGGFNRFPEFLELVRRQLHRDYREEDLTSTRLKIFTTLDPYVQRIAEENLAATLADLEERDKRQGLEGAVVVTNRSTGEIEAVGAGVTRYTYTGLTSNSSYLFGVRHRDIYGGIGPSASLHDNTTGANLTAGAVTLAILLGAST